MKKKPYGKTSGKIWKKYGKESSFIYFGKPLGKTSATVPIVEETLVQIANSRRSHWDRNLCGHLPRDVVPCRLGTEKGDPPLGSRPRFRHRLENQMISYSVPSISTVTTLSMSMLLGMTCFPLSSPAASCFALGFFSGVKSLMSFTCFSSAGLPFTR